MTPKIDEKKWNAIINKSHDIEFDWIGVDQIGQLGAFSSFNNAYIPRKSILSFEKYQQLYKLIENLPFISTAVLFTKEIGDFTDWLIYSRKGLFSFDYQDIHRERKLNIYDLISKPSKPLLATHIEHIDLYQEILPQFDLTFNNNISFESLKEKER